MRCQECQQPATLHLTEAHRRSAVGERHLCEEHAHRYLKANPPSALGPGWALPPRPQRPQGVVAAAAVEGITDTPACPASREVEVDVVRVIISETHEQQVVFLREVAGHRSFPLVLGIFEATALDWTLKELPSPRPLTHDVWAATIVALGGQVRDVLVNDLREHTYYTTVRIDHGGRVVAVDSRPSDAFILALKCGVPILVAETVLDEASSPGI
jgi:bifunctional DNase/RNase